jgi:ubiquinone/menaquinone biosynthesis C-methylase UbiE
MRLGEPPPRPRTYGDADGYEAYMGGWSGLLAQSFLRFALTEPRPDLLDIGCGTGNLLIAARKMFSAAGLTGIDPSVALLARARGRSTLENVWLVRAVAEALPFRAAAFDAVLSLLVLQEFPEPLQALTEMRRVVRAGGAVAACQWDFALMPVITALVDALAEVAPAAALGLRASPVFAGEGELRQAWLRAGFTDVTVTRIRVTRRFADFDALWRPLLSGPTPSTLTLAGLASVEREAVAAIMRQRLAAAEPFAIAAEALAVRGLA